MSDKLGMSLDDIVASNRQRQEKPKREAKPAAESGGARGSGKAPRAPRNRDGHDDRTRPSRPSFGERQGDRQEFAARAAANPRKRVVVTGIRKMSANVLREIFEGSGLEIVDVEVSGGTGTVAFARYEQAEKAVREYDHAVVDGSEIRVKPFVTSDDQRESRPAHQKREMFGSAMRHEEKSGSIVVKKPSSKVRVTNLPFDLSEDEVTQIFRECGRI